MGVLPKALSLALRSGSGRGEGNGSSKRWCSWAWLARILRRRHDLKVDLLATLQTPDQPEELLHPAELAVRYGLRLSQFGIRQDTRGGSCYGAKLPTQASAWRDLHRGIV